VIVVFFVLIIQNRKENYIFYVICVYEMVDSANLGNSGNSYLTGLM